MGTTWVRVARIGKPSGVAGRVTVQVFTDEPAQRFTPGAALARDDAGEQPLTIASVGRSGARWVLGFEGVTDRTAAESMRHLELYAAVPDDELPDDPDEWYDWQLVGLPCRLADGTVVGDVVAVEHPPAHDLLVVQQADGTQRRVPFVAAIVPEVGRAGIVLQPPDGLLDGDEGGAGR